MNTASESSTLRDPLPSLLERRQSERFGACMPLRADGYEGLTLDLSTTGVSFETEHEFALGDQIEVVIDYLLDGHQYPLRTDAEVVRVERCDGGYVIGARLCQPFAP